jgi:hypothetical protein
MRERERERERECVVHTFLGREMQRGWERSLRRTILARSVSWEKIAENGPRLSVEGSGRASTSVVNFFSGSKKLWMASLPRSIATRMAPSLPRRARCIWSSRCQVVAQLWICVARFSRTNLITNVYLHIYRCNFFILCLDPNTSSLSRIQSCDRELLHTWAL